MRREPAFHTGGRMSTELRTAGSFSFGVGGIMLRGGHGRKMCHAYGARRGREEGVMSTKRNHIRIALLIAGLALAAPVAISQESEPVKPFAQPPHIIVVTATDFQFPPSPIHIKAGQNIQLQVTATDKTHGIRINPFPDGAGGGTAPGLQFVYGEDCTKLKKGVMVKIELVGYTPGSYTFSCCKSCGSGHKRMKGQLIVDP